MKQRDQVETELEYNFNETELRKWKCYSFDRLGKIPNIISNALSSLQRTVMFKKWEYSGNYFFLYCILLM